MPNDHNKWRHVENELLRRILSRKPADVSDSDINRGVERTLNQLGRDAVALGADSVFQARRTIAQKAVRAMNSGLKPSAHRYLKQFWLS